MRHFLIQSLIFGIAASAGAQHLTAGELPPMPAPVLNVLRNRCILCHDEVEASFGRLDLSHWTAAPDGKDAFVHQDAAGAQLPAQESFRRILNRVTTTDLDQQMPLGGALSAEELAPLQSWLEARLAR